jgi:hypothetical protein
MNNKYGYFFIVLGAVLVLMVAAAPSVGATSVNPKKVSPLGDFKNIPPIVLQSQSGKQAKFDMDVLYDVGAVSGEPYVAVNHRAHDANIKLRGGEEISIYYGQPFSTTDYVKASLVKGKIDIQKGPNGFVRINGQEIALVQDFNPDGSSNAQIPVDLKKGSYKLVVVVTYNEELRGYYITNVKIGK